MERSMGRKQNISNIPLTLEFIFKVYTGMPGILKRFLFKEYRGMKKWCYWLWKQYIRFSKQKKQKQKQKLDEGILLLL